MEYVEVLLPSVCVAVLFYFVMKALLGVDRSERKALAEAEREADRESAGPARQVEMGNETGDGDK